MKLEIMTADTPEEYLEHMSLCKDWMSYRLARVYMTICNEAKYSPSVDDVTEYVGNHSHDGYLKEGCPNDHKVLKDLILKVELLKEL